MKIQMTLNKDGKREGWDYQYYMLDGRKISHSIPVFYENGIATKISSNAGIQDFNDIQHAMYLRGINDDIMRGQDDKIYILEDCTFDTEFLKKIMPYAHFTWKNKEPKQYTFIENFEY